MTNTISNTDDTINSRDVIARIEELQVERDDVEALREDAPSMQSWADANPEDAAELAALEKLAEEAEGYAPDWQHGSQLIRDSYFEQAMDDLCEDIGDIPQDLPSYLAIVIDYTALQQDYTAVDFDGVTYWVR